MQQEYIIIKGAKEHNLKNIDIKIPKYKLVVFTGVSGSGKSTIIFDIIYAQGQRRYLELLSTYARQFLKMLKKPDIDDIKGLSPVVAISQKGISHNPRSTVGTITEIYDYLRVLFAKIGDIYCYKCFNKITPLSISEIFNEIFKIYKDEKIEVIAPSFNTTLNKVFIEKYRQLGYLRIKINNKTYFLDEDINLKEGIYDIDIVISRAIINDKYKERIFQSIEDSIRLTKGFVKIKTQNTEKLYTTIAYCPKCKISYNKIDSNDFSFNSPQGACKTCKGLGYVLDFDKDLFIDKDLSLNEGAILSNLNFIPNARFSHNIISKETLNKIFFSFDNNLAIKDFPEEDRDKLFTIIKEELQKRYNTTQSDFVRKHLEKLLSFQICPTCKGARLKKEALNVKINGYNIYQISKMQINQLKEFLNNLKLQGNKKIIARPLINIIQKKLTFLEKLGVSYLSLDRPASTLSGGENQRIRLANIIGTELVNILYILDEPTIGLHPRDIDRLIKSLEDIRDEKNTVLVVEHEQRVIEKADYIIDIGPLAGIYGGKIIAQGSLQDIKNNDKSLTGRYLSKKEKISIPDKFRKTKKYIKLIGVNHNNLKNLNIDIPLNILTGISGVSGSGKSSLIIDVLYKNLHNLFNKGYIKSGKVKSITGYENINGVMLIDQSPIGKTPRSNPATYIGVFELIRQLYANLSLSKTLGYNASYFSFNTGKGRCNICKGEGQIKVSMQFLEDIYVMCDACNGKRYNKAVLEILYKGFSIADILDLTVKEAIEVFKNHYKILEKLSILEKVGLDYIKLGQPSNTLSGGESQRLKIARQLAKRKAKGLLYILDEPTVGLHFNDVKKLLKVLHLLVENGNSVIVIEHNIDVLKNCDYIIDLGPEGGDKGGKIIAQGTPLDIAKNKNSYTGVYLKEALKGI